MKVEKVCSMCGRIFSRTEDFYAKTSRWRICENKHLWFNCQCGSTNIIRHGSYAWYDQTRNLSETAKSLFNHTPKLDMLPRIPTRVMELEVMLGDEKTDAESLAEIARSDPILCAMILKFANCRASSRTKVTSLSHAISYIGFSQMRDLVTMASISRLDASTKIFSTTQFWQEAMLVGRMTEALVSKLEAHIDVDISFIAGCLCNIGKIVTALCYPEIADRISEEMNNPQRPCSWIEVEERFCGFQHTVMGEIGAMFWGLPEEVSDVIAHHHVFDPRNNNSRQVLVDVVSLANQYTHWVSQRNHRMNMALFEGLLSKFRIHHKMADDWHKEFSKLLKQ